MVENQRTQCLAQDGFEIHRRVFSVSEIEMLKVEADRVAAEVGSACVRNLNSRSEMFRELANSSKLRNIFTKESLLAVRSLLFDKTAQENWPVAWHQDLTIATKAEISCEGYGPWSVKDGVPHAHAPTELLQKMVTARIHLDLTDEENGALIVAPASHLLGKIPAASIPDLIGESVFTCICEPGDVLLMSPLLLHSSHRSTKPSRRRILHFEYAPPDSLHTLLNWYETASIPAESHFQSTC